MRAIVVPESEDTHIAHRREGSSRHDYRKTACLMEREDGEPEFKQTAALPTCPFCIRDANMIPELREELWLRLRKGDAHGQRVC